MKTILLNKCLQIIRENKELIQKNIHFAQEASKSDTKSSAGDKYETTRAMMQIEIENNEKRLAENQLLENTLLSMDITTIHKKIMVGTLVITNNGKFFVSIGIGQVRLDEENNNEIYFIISPASPIGAVLMHKTTKDTFLFRQKEYQILEIL